MCKELGLPPTHLKGPTHTEDPHPTYRHSSGPRELQLAPVTGPSEPAQGTAQYGEL